MGCPTPHTTETSRHHTPCFTCRACRFEREELPVFLSFSFVFLFVCPCHIFTYIFLVTSLWIPSVSPPPTMFSTSCETICLNTNQPLCVGSVISFFFFFFFFCQASILRTPPVSCLLTSGFYHSKVFSYYLEWQYPSTYLFTFHLFIYLFIFLFI